MDSALCSDSVLLVSSSDFVVGLLKGYCLANSLVLDVRSTLPRLYEQDSGRRYRLVIVDLRAGHAMLAQDDADQLLYYFKLRESHNVTLCAIRDYRDRCFLETLPEFDCVVEEPVIENLERFLGERETQLPSAGVERRRHERRQCQDRRAEHPGLHFLANRSTSRAACAKRGPDRLQLGPFAIDRHNRSLYLYDKDLELTTKEYDLFQLLASDNERAFSTDTIIKALWPKNHRANKADLYQYVHLLRRKIEVDPCHPRWLLTVKGVGYRLCVEDTSARMSLLPVSRG